MREEDTIVARVTRVLTTRLVIDAPGADFDLFESGVLDSLGFADLLVGLEHEFHIHFALDEIDVDEFRTIRALGAVVARTLAAAAPVVRAA